MPETRIVIFNKRTKRNPATNNQAQSYTFGFKLDISDGDEKLDQLAKSLREELSPLSADFTFRLVIRNPVATEIIGVFVIAFGQEIAKQTVKRMVPIIKRVVARFKRELAKSRKNRLKGAHKPSRKNKTRRPPRLQIFG